MLTLLTLPLLTLLTPWLELLDIPTTFSSFIQRIHVLIQLYHQFLNIAPAKKGSSMHLAKPVSFGKRNLIKIVFITPFYVISDQTL